MKRTFTEISATDNNDENFEPSQRRPLRLKEDTLSGIMDSVDRDNGGNSSSHLPSQDQEPAVKKVIMIGNNNETKTQGCPKGTVAKPCRWKKKEVMLMSKNSFRSRAPTSPPRCFLHLSFRGYTQQKSCKNLVTLKGPINLILTWIQNWLMTLCNT